MVTRLIHIQRWLLHNYGKLDESDPASGKDWIQYVEQIKYYFMTRVVTGSINKCNGHKSLQNFGISKF